jgi:hypothetical protein
VVVEHTSNSSTWEADVGGSRLQASLGFIMRTCTKKRQHNKKVEERILNISVQRIERTNKRGDKYVYSDLNVTKYIHISHITNYPINM